SKHKHRGLASRTRRWDPWCAPVTMPIGRRLRRVLHRRCEAAAMLRRHLVLRAGAWLALPVWGQCVRAAAVTEADAASAIRQALERGAISAVSLLGKTDGFLGNPKVRIPLPEHLEDAANMLRRFGQSKRVDELITSMNRAAEQAVPEAKGVLVQAAKAVTVDDALHIVRGGETSVTDYFAIKTRQPLGERFLPIVSHTTEKVALADKYNAVAGQASKFGLVKG